jgi:hypothetical protein
MAKADMSLPLRIKNLYLEKSESVINLPHWLLPRKKMERYREAASRLAIVEIAGRDSIAAALQAVEEGAYTDLLPTYAFTGTECGSLQDVEGAVARLSDRLPGIAVHELLLIGSSRFWQALNGRFIGEFISRFGFYSPCIGCHLYLHSVRIPLAVKLGGVVIISGERESHDGRVKINQISEAVERYQHLTKAFGIPLLLPLRHMTSGGEVERILGSGWEEGQDQLGCVLSGNYRMLNGNIGISREQVTAYLDEFAVPFARKAVSMYLEGRVPDFMEIAERTLRK